MSLVTDHLSERGVRFQVLPHRRAVTSLQEANAVGVAADEVVKTVALWTGGKYVLAVVPASRRLDLHLVRAALEDPAARLATEAELGADFPGYELGALPPLGSLLGVPLVVDPEVLGHEVVVFAAGTETESVRVVTAELFRDEPLAVMPLARQDRRPARPHPLLTGPDRGRAGHLRRPRRHPQGRPAGPPAGPAPPEQGRAGGLGLVE